MRTSAILKGRTDSNGHIQIQIRVSSRQDRRFYPTGIRVARTQFENGRVVDHPKASAYNGEIKRLIIVHQAANIEGLKPKQPKVEFYSYMQTCIDGWQMVKREGTIRIYASLVRILKRFRPRLYLHEVDLQFLKDFQAYRLRQVEGNTVWSNFSKLRAVLNEARSQRLIADYPFDDFAMPPYKQGIPVYLDKEELLAIETMLPSLNGLAHYGFWFLIASYTGFRVSDILQFDPQKHIKKDKILVHTEKEGTIVSIPFTAKLQSYFEKIRYQRLGCSEETYREKIKTIALAAGIKKEISTHTARHTAAVYMASAGLSIEVVAKILGHKSLKSTQVYFQIVNKKLDEDYRAFDEWMGGGA